MRSIEFDAVWTDETARTETGEDWEYIKIQILAGTTHSLTLADSTGRRYIYIYIYILYQQSGVQWTCKPVAEHTATNGDLPAGHSSIYSYTSSCSWASEYTAGASKAQSEKRIRALRYTVAQLVPGMHMQRLLGWLVTSSLCVPCPNCIAASHLSSLHSRRCTLTPVCLASLWCPVRTSTWTLEWDGHPTRLRAGNHSCIYGYPAKWRNVAQVPLQYSPLLQSHC